MRAIISGDKYIGRTSKREYTPDLNATLTRASDQRTFVLEKLSQLHAEKGITLVIGGEEGGAERLGLTWARMNKIPVLLVERERRFFREESGDERLARMVTTTKADLVIAIGDERSVAHLVKRAQAAGLPVARIDDVPG